MKVVTCHNRQSDIMFHGRICGCQAGILFQKAVIPVILITLVLPVHATLVPRYMMFRVFGWLNTYLPLTVPVFAMQGFFCYLFIQFMRMRP